MRHCLTLSLLLSLAWAQEPLSQPAGGSWNHISVQGAGSTPDGLWVPGLGLSLQKQEGEALSLNPSALLRYGLNHRLELGLDLFKPEGEVLQPQGYAKLRLLGALPTAGGLGLALGLRLYDDLEPYLALEGRRWDLRAALNLGLRGPLKERSDSSDRLYTGLALGRSLGSETRWLMGELLMELPEVGSPHLEAALGLRLFFSSGPVLLLGFSAALWGEQPLLQGFLRLDWQKIPRDLDKDTILDLQDHCPRRPEDRNGFRDEDGCPDPDNDQDGIPDERDLCPDLPESRNGRFDEDGCPDVGDRDADGLPEDLDLCPNKPEDHDHFQDGDGCPDLDDDRDGVPDLEDHCLLKQEDLDGFLDEDGCPDPDNDEDGLLDEIDRCPREAGPVEEQGCPKNIQPQIRAELLEIRVQLEFAPRRHALRAVHQQLLEELLMLLQEHPEVLKIEIQGRRDPQRERRRRFKRLGLKRAEAVKAWLLKRGIAPERLAVKDYGLEDSEEGARLSFQILTSAAEQERQDQ